LLYGLFATDAEDIVRNQRALDERLATLNRIARVNEESFSGRN
jgi:hypothetical protein